MAKNEKSYVVVIDQDLIEPDLARETVIKYDPLNRPGKEGGFYIENDELHIDEDDVMEAHKMAINKYPHEGAIKMVQLVSEEGEKVHQFGENEFRLYGIPRPAENEVTGVVGANGLGKTVASQILSGEIKPNLGNYDKPPQWSKILKKFRGTEVQNHFRKVKEGGLETAVKPQKVDRIAEQFDGTLEEFFQEHGEKQILEQEGLEHLKDREVEELSGGELQQALIALTARKPADFKVFDEPSTYLDVGKRLQAARTVSGLDSTVLAVEHDLAALDLLSDRINVFYGEKGSYGMVSEALSPKHGINQYLDGRLKSENIRFRDRSISFETRKGERGGSKAFSWDELGKSFDEYSLTVAPGSLRREEVTGVLGRNGLGKTVFAKMLAGAITPDTGSTPEASVSFKPQYLEASEATLEDVLPEEANTETKRFENRIEKPLELEELYERPLNELSGGELQRAAVAICLSREADAYLLDEPSAFLDVESRVKLGETLREFARKEEEPVLLIDHDLALLDHAADRGIVFKGEPGRRGEASKIQPIEDAIDDFLAEIGVTFRKDPETGRPRANKPGSQKEKEQKESGNFYES